MRILERPEMLVPVELQYRLDRVERGRRAATHWEETLQGDLRCFMEVSVAVPCAV